ncbi:MAG: PDZ domain-containing protein, partial [Candidatus Eremiobacterota bacterium]
MAPPASRFKKFARQFVRAATLAVLVSLVLFAVPSPYVLRAPGRAEPVAGRVTVRGARTFPSYGRLLMTTILYERASLLTCLYAMMDPASELLPASMDREERYESPDLDTRLSQYSARVAALRHLGYSLEMEPVGVRVIQPVPGGPSVGRIQPGDLIRQALGVPVRTTGELRGLVLKNPPGRPIDLLLERQDREFTVRVVPAPMGGQRLLGLQIQTQLAPRPLPVDVEIDTDGIVGASAGLIFSLQIVDLLTSNDLTGGRTVAGTGTIEPDGAVGPVLGVRMKAVAARRAGATVFLCPRENEAEARDAVAGL